MNEDLKKEMKTRIKSNFISV